MSRRLIFRQNYFEAITIDNVTLNGGNGTPTFDMWVVTAVTDWKHDTLVYVKMTCLGISGTRCLSCTADHVPQRGICRRDTRHVIHALLTTYLSTAAWDLHEGHAHFYMQHLIYGAVQGL